MKTILFGLFWSILIIILFEVGQQFISSENLPSFYFGLGWFGSLSALSIYKKIMAGA